MYDEERLITKIMAAMSIFAAGIIVGIILAGSVVNAASPEKYEYLEIKIMPEAQLNQEYCRNMRLKYFTQIVSLKVKDRGLSELYDKYSSQSEQYSQNQDKLGREICRRMKITAVAPELEKKICNYEKNTEESK